MQALIRQAGSGVALPAAQVDGILRRGEGNPLFLEELTWAAVEQVEAPGGAEVPATVQTVIAARVDRLSADAKHLLQVAAVVGREVPERLLRAAVELESAAVGPGLATLCASELLFASQRGDEPWYTFKHALTQDVAYQSLLKGVRKAFHLRVAAALEQHFPELVATQPELLAQHLTRADAAARAVVYWQHAGERAMERAAHAEAVAHFTQALDLLAGQSQGPERDRLELALRTTLGLALLITRGHGSPEVALSHARVRELTISLGLVPPWLSEIAVDLVAARLPQARQGAAQLAALGVAEGQPEYESYGETVVGFVLMHEGQIARAHELLLHAKEIYRDEHRYLVHQQGHDSGVASRVYLAHCLWLLGYPTRARAELDAGLVLARQIEYPFGLAMAIYMAAWYHTYYRELAAVASCAAEAMAISAAHVFPMWLASARVVDGWVRAEQTPGDEPIALIENGIKDWKATGAEVGGPYFYSLLAEACLGAGRVAQGRAALSEARALRDKNGEHYWESEIDRIEGELHLVESPADADAAERCFERALGVAREQGARSLELRAATSLARVLATRGGSEPRRGRTLLAAVYDTFTEGHDTADLVTAKTLLDALER